MRSGTFKGQALDAGLVTQPEGQLGQTVPPSLVPEEKSERSHLGQGFYEVWDLHRAGSGRWVGHTA